MTRLGLHENFCSWIMQCLSSVRYSILLNGEAQGMITPTRGIRQGDPLSPYIFILCSEVLSGLCTAAQRRVTLAGLQVSCRSPKINRLLFADDTMFFAKTNPKSVAALKEVIERYKRESGQAINAAKSAITFSWKMPQGITDRVKNSLGIAKEGGQGKYLGLPDHFGRRKRVMFTPIVDRIRQKAMSWSTRQLSAGGKMVMLQSVFSATPSFSMLCFKLPKSLTKRIQTALTRFWWDADPDKKKIC